MIASNAPFVLIYIFLVLSGVYAIIVSLATLTKGEKNTNSDSTLQTKIFKYTAPAGFVYGILSISLVIIFTKIDKTGELNDNLTELKIQYDRLVEEKNNLMNSFPDSLENEPMKFVEEVKTNTPKSIFNGNVLIVYNYGAFSANTIKFIGVKGLDKNKNGYFDKNEIIVEVGDRFFVKLESSTIYGVNVLDLIGGIKLEFFKI